MVVDLSVGWKMSDWNSRGECLFQKGLDSNNYVYVNIPKNASSWIKEQFNGKEHNYINNPIDATYVVALRDPVSRWISGAAQAFSGCPPDNPHFFLSIGFNAIFDHIVFDEHTAPQTMFLDKIDYNQTVWFNCDYFLTENWNSWANNKIVPMATEFKLYADSENLYNISALSRVKQVNAWQQQKIIDMLTNHLNTCPLHLRQLKEFYADDYKLIQSVKFYDPR